MQNETYNRVLFRSIVCTGGYDLVHACALLSTACVNCLAPVLTRLDYFGLPCMYVKKALYPMEDYVYEKVVCLFALMRLFLTACTHCLAPANSLHQIGLL